MREMYPASVNSIATELAADINATQTTITLADASVIPPAPNLLTIGNGEGAETIRYGGKSGNQITDVTRGFQGKAADWRAGTSVARYFTAYDADAARENIASVRADASNAASTYGLSSSSFTTVQEAINEAIRTGKQLVISGNQNLNSERLLINGPITIVLSNNAFFTQTEFAYPIFEVRSRDVKFYGKLRAKNTGKAYHVIPSEISSRGLTVPIEVSNDPKGYSAVVACIGNVDNLHVDHIEGYNFVSTISFLSAVSTDKNYSNNVTVNYAYGERQWQTVLGGGFKSAILGEIVGRDMVKSQGDNPDHVVYIGTRPNAPDHYIYINRVIGYDSPNMSYIAQIKTVNEFVCNEVVGFNCSKSLHIGEGCPNAKVEIVKGVYVVNPVDKDSVLKVAGGSNCSIGTIDMTTSEMHDSAIQGAAVSASGSGTVLAIKNVKLKLTSTSSPIKAIRSAATIKLHTVDIEYSSLPVEQPILCAAGSVYIYNPPVIKGAGNLVFQGINIVDYLLTFDPNLIDGVMDDTTISINTNDFSKLVFKAFDKTPVEQNAIINTYNLRARNVLKLSNGGATLNILSRGAHMQEYMLICGANDSSPAIAHGTGNIFLKSGNNYSANSWKVLRFICVNDKFYEI